MNTFEQIVREEIRSVIASIVRTELAKLTESVVNNNVEVKRSGGRKRSKLTVQLAGLQPNWSIDVTARRLTQARNSTRYLARKFGMCFSIRQYGDGYRILCLQAMPSSNLEQVNG